MKKSHNKANLIVSNPGVFHHYSIESRIEAGIVLSGWEVRSIRNKRMHLKESHVRVINNEVWLINAHISPLPYCMLADKDLNPTKTRKLLLHKLEISRLIGAVGRKGYTLVPIKAYWRKHSVKIELGLGKGKHARDKRLDKKLHDWEREKNRLLKTDF